MAGEALIMHTTFYVKKLKHNFSLLNLKSDNLCFGHSRWGS